MEIRCLSHSSADTDRLGRIIGAEIQPDTVIGLVGELGTGKTTFVKSVGAALNIPAQDITSPTFTLLHRYDPAPGFPPLCHLDAYRLSHADDLIEIGFQELLYSGAVVVIEWADRIMAALPEDHILIHFYHTGEDNREIVIRAAGDFHTALLQRIDLQLKREPL